jgi:phosphatidylserine synthase
LTPSVAAELFGCFAFGAISTGRRRNNKWVYVAAGLIDGVDGRVRGYRQDEGGG